MNRASVFDGLVSLFNGISTFVGFFNAKAILLEEQLCYHLTHSWEDKGVHTFPKGICPKVNVITRLEYELAYYDSAVHCFNHYTTRTPHQFLSGIRDSRKAGSLWRKIKGVGGVRKSIGQSWLAKDLGLGLGLLCWGFKGVQEEIRSEEASTLHIESVAFPPGQYTSQQLHSCHRLFDQDGPQESSPNARPPYSPDLGSCDFWLFPKLRGCRYEKIEEMKEAVVKVIDIRKKSGNI